MPLAVLNLSDHPFSVSLSEETGLLITVQVHEAEVPFVFMEGTEPRFYDGDPDSRTRSFKDGLS
jgi:hypothetical protein